MIKVIDNVIPKDYQDYIFHLVTEPDFPLYFKKNIVTHKYDMSQNIHGFIHSLYDENAQKSNYFSPIYPLVLNITEKTGVKFHALDRMRFNFILGNPDSKLDHHLPHVDNFLPHYVAIYYVNDCDGDTVIFNEMLDIPTIERDEEFIERNQWTIKERVSPKKGRMVIFDGRYYHASSFTKTQPFRCVINMNLAVFQL
jgi:hypothetical protein